MIGEDVRGGADAAARFDLLWASGFSNAAVRGLPDVEMAWLERRLDAITDALAVTSLPMIVDADTGGDTVTLAALVQRLEALGASAVVVEDKCGAKRTSLADGARHELEDPEVFAGKLAAAQDAQASGEMMIFARIEALIAGLGVPEALRRAEIYLRSAADGLVIHSKDRSGGEVLAFLDAYRQLCGRVGTAKPVICIPTAYNHVPDQDLFDRGAAIVIHANHMVRAAYHAMRVAGETILSAGRSLEADPLCADVGELIAAVARGEHAPDLPTETGQRDLGAGNVARRTST